MAELTLLASCTSFFFAPLLPLHRVLECGRSRRWCFSPGPSAEFLVQNYNLLVVCLPGTRPNLGNGVCLATNICSPGNISDKTTRRLAFKNKIKKGWGKYTSRLTHRARMNGLLCEEFVFPLSFVFKENVVRLQLTGTCVQTRKGAFCSLNLWICTMRGVAGRRCRENSGLCPTSGCSAT